MSRAPLPKLRPTRFGVVFLALVLLTLVGCINYGLSLGYGLTFLLGGIWIVTAAQALRQVRLLTLKVLSPGLAVAGQDAEWSAQVGHQGRGGNVRLRAVARQEHRQQSVGASGSVSETGVKALPLRVPSPLRGPLTLENLEIGAVDALGLWHAWLPAQASAEILVAPAPESSPPPPTTLARGEGDNVQRTAGQDEFAGLRPYQAGDSPRLISWRHAARTGQLLTREFDAPAGEALMLDYAALPGDPEARLSRLAAWVLVAAQRGQAFGLKLPQQTLPVASGEAQVRAASRSLALVTPFPLPAAPPVAGRAPLPRAGKGAALPPAALPATALRFSLLALGFSLLPGLVHWPIWVSALCLGLLGYAASQAGGTRKSAGKSAVSASTGQGVVLALLALGTVAGLSAQYGTLAELGASTAILATLMCLKAVETRIVRDAKLLSLLALFLLITHFFADQGPLTALHSVLSLTLSLAAAMRWVNPDTWAEVRREEKGPGKKHKASRWRAAGGLVMLAAPIAVALFFLFPRPAGPLWRLPFQGQNQTGLSNEISAGSLTNLAQSDALAFRADFEGGLPPQGERYWRGPVYEAYDGVRWVQVGFRFPVPSVEYFSGGPKYSYSLTLEPNGRPWLLALDTPDADTLPPNVALTSSFQAVARRAPTMRTRFQLQSTAARLGRQESEERLNYDLRLPSGQNPRALALAQGWRALPPEERIQAALNYFNQNGFSYTLSPPLLAEQDRVDDFLFNSKQGFCEHYASAFGFLMRAAGLPTRLVAGYQGGEVGLGGQYITVRQREAHAWNEVWLQGRGWVRIDPTAAVAPARVRADVGTALAQPNAEAARPPTTLDRLRLQFDSFQNSWNNWVAAYDGEQQQSMLARLGIGGVGSAPYMLGLVGLVALLLLPMLALIRRAARPKDPALATLHDLSERLGLPRGPGETASDYVRRAAGQYPQQAALLGEIASLFNEWRYAPAPGPELLAKLREKVRQVRKK